MRAKFYFIRHAETSWNKKNLCQGQRNIPLNKKGLEDAKHVAQQLSKVKFDCIISSPLCRALDTAKEIHKIQPNADFHTVPQLSERSWGMLEGMSSKEMYRIEKLEELDPFYKPGKKVEERDKFRKRIKQGLLIAQSYNLHPLIVSHGRVFLEICLILGMPLMRQIPNCQLIEVTQQDCGWHINFIREAVS